ncbi:MAG TPA: CoA-binding protein [Melioribacteraceae bacterium]|nr:CoA-binding protein [Melioribacteraceae bacterium]
MYKNDLEIIGNQLRTAKTIAVLGFSKYPNKTSREIANFLVDKGYTVIGINPTIEEPEIDGIKIYKNLSNYDGNIDIVNVFRKSNDIPEIIEDVLACNPKILWLQQGIRNDFAIRIVKEKGITVYQDMCIAVYHNLCKYQDLGMNG